ncbi:MAG: ABC transporter ATP-binding protein [Gammaproteobacteria bacterium]
MSATGLDVTALSHRYGDRVILRELSFSVAGGEFVAICGESGSGKSTLLNLIAGLEAPTAGSIRLDDTEILGLTDDQRTRLRRSKVGFVFQAFHVLPHLSVAQNVELPLVLLGVPAGERIRRTLDMLAAVGLRDRSASAPRELSGGELQRVAVARALVHRPALVLADEPTGNLDPESAGTVLSLLGAQARSAGAATLLVTHSSTAAACADRVLRLVGGRLQAADSRADAGNR